MHGQGQQQLSGGDLAHCGRAAFQPVGGLGAEPVEAALGVGDAVHLRGPPPALGGEAVAALHHPLAVAPPRRADVDRHPIVLGHGREAGQHRAGGGRARRRGAVEAPAPRRAAQPPQHPIDAIDERRLIFALAEDPPHLSAVRQRADQQVHGAAPGCRQLEEVPLDLLASGMADLDRGTLADPGAGLAMRTQPATADGLGEAQVGAAIAEPVHLVPERRRPDVRILSRRRSVPYAR